MQQNEKKSGRIQLMLPERTVPFEITAECTLPDYRSEISRLLWVRPTILPPERFVGGGRTEFSGKILFEMLYTGPDGVLYCADHEQGYSFTVPQEGAYATQGAELFAEPVIDAVISRVTGPRRLTVRCRSHAYVHGIAEKELALTQRGLPDNAVPHLLCDALETGFVTYGGREEMLLSDSIACEEDERAICARGSALLNEVHTLTDEVRVCGEALVCVLCCKGEQSTPTVRERRIPFECRVPLEGVRPDCSACATATVGRIELSKEDGQLTLSPQLILTAQAQKNEPTALSRDIFLPGQKAACRFEELAAWQAGSCDTRHFSINVSRNAEELAACEDPEILDHVCEAEICEKGEENGKLVLSGKLQCHLLCRRGGELCVQDASLPFRLLPGFGTASAHADCRVADCRLRMQGGVLCADAELQLSLCDMSPLPLRALCEVEFTPCAPEPREAIELYYPAPAQTLWDVAKKYGVSPDALAEANALDADAPDATDSLAGKRFLLIPQ